MPLVTTISWLASAAARASRPVGSLAAALLELALPDVCAACERPPGPLCAACHADLREGLFDRPRRAMPDPVPPHLPTVVAAGPYAGVLRRLVSAYKDDERRDLRRLLARLLVRSLEQVVGARIHRVVTTTDDGMPDRPVLVVPVPSSRAAVRRRGDDPVADLARAATRLLVVTEGRETVVEARGLRPVRRLADQSRLDHRARAVNLAGAYAVTPRWADRLAGSRVVLVDDVVTTGSTLAEAARAVRAAGGQVVGAATLAATSRRGRVTDPAADPSRASGRRIGPADSPTVGEGRRNAPRPTRKGASRSPPRREGLRS